jgi:hypothetical protein
VHAQSGLDGPLPSADVIYVNAGVTDVPAVWLDALTPGGRLVLPLTPTGRLSDRQEPNFWLAHWAPGMDGHDFPEGTGIRMSPGAGLVVQMHYYGGAAPGERDAGTRMDFRVADRVDRPAFHFSQTRSAWLNGERNGSMVIPPGEMATFEVSTNLAELLPQVVRVTGIAPAGI